MRGGPRRTSRVGLVPPAGMVVSKSFGGFEDVAKDSAILIAAQPPAAYPEIEKGLAADVLKKNGITVDNREKMKFDFGKGTLVIGKQTADKTRYRKWLLNVQTKELTALVNVHIPGTGDCLPRRRLACGAGDAGGARDDPGRGEAQPAAVHAQRPRRLPCRKRSSRPSRMLVDTPDGVPTDNFDVRMFIAAFDGGPGEICPFGQTVGIKDIKITMSEPLRGRAAERGYELHAYRRGSPFDRPQLSHDLRHDRTLSCPTSAVCGVRQE